MVYIPVLGTSTLLQWGLTLSSEETQCEVQFGASIERFNGASLFRARKRVHSRANVQVPTGFNGASLFRARKLRSSIRDSAVCRCFNGASLFRARKRSTKPKPNLRPESFNGASLFRARKPAFAAWENTIPRLQWGLTLSSEETCLPTVKARHYTLCFNGASLFRARKPRMWYALPLSDSFASMGPHSFERGNHFQGLRRSESWNASMGPHSFERGNSRASLTTSPSTCPLQWGLTLSSEETWHCASGGWQGDPASMGPHSFERGNLPRPSRSLPTPQRFNGASLFRARKRD